jgi:hypothetical protein
MKSKYVVISFIDIGSIFCSKDEMKAAEKRLKGNHKKQRLFYKELNR